LEGIVVTGAVSGLLVTVGLAQAPRASQTQRPDGSTPESDSAVLPAPAKTELEKNEKDIKQKVERLYELATELKAEVDKTDSSKVLSLVMVKKAQEIEKLAKDIAVRSKG
jgi:hypothetical protein